jgi:adenylate kinase
MRNFLLIGPPGSGKGALSERICASWNLTPINAGNLLRIISKEKSPLGNQVKENISQGKLVSDSIMNQIILENLQSDPKVNGFLFDGYPRNLFQTQYIDNLIKFEKVIILNVEDYVMKKRIQGRYVCSTCKKSYSIYDRAFFPKKIGFCDKCLGPLEHRNDDNEAIFTERLKIYKFESKPIICFYQDRIINLDGTKTVDILESELSCILGSFPCVNPM